MKGKNENAEVLLWIIFILVLAGIGWFGYKYLKKKLQNKTGSEETISDSGNRLLVSGEESIFSGMKNPKSKK